MPEDDSHSPIVGIGSRATARAGVRSTYNFADSEIIGRAKTTQQGSTMGDGSIDLASNTGDGNPVKSLARTYYAKFVEDQAQKRAAAAEALSAALKENEVREDRANHFGRRNLPSDHPLYKLRSQIREQIEKLERIGEADKIIVITIDPVEGTPHLHMTAKRSNLVAGNHPTHHFAIMLEEGAEGALRFSVNGQAAFVPGAISKRGNELTALLNQDEPQEIVASAAPNPGPALREFIVGVASAIRMHSKVLAQVPAETKATCEMILKTIEQERPRSRTAIAAQIQLKVA